MNTIYSVGGDTKEVQAQAISAIRAGAQARYLKLAGRFGWETKLIEVTSDNRCVRVVFENGVNQDYSISTFCNTFGLHPVPVKSDPLDEVGDFIVWSATGTHNPTVVHKTQRIAEMEAQRLTREHRKVFCVMKCVAISKPVCTAELTRK